MKKVGILTFHGSKNYGSVLQAYALQQVFGKLNCKCEIIDFFTDRQEEMYKVFRKPNNLKNIMIDIAALLDYHFMKSRYTGFQRFIKEKIILSPERYKTYDGLKNVAEQYDVFCVGSDQVWNMAAEDYDRAYLLEFTKRRKFAYAPSIGGMDNLKKWAARVGNKEQEFMAIDNLDCISIREASAMKVLKKYTNKSIEVVLDPTLLLSKNDWRRVSNERKIRKKYIFLYTIGYDENSVRLAKAVAAIFHLPIVTLYTLRTSYKTFLKGIRRTYHQAPEDFLRYIDNAEFVITNTFHGTAFSINYRKNFLVSSAHDEFGEVSTDERINNILTITGLRDRVFDIDSQRLEEIALDVDYSNIYNKLQPYIESSLEFIRRGIG